MPSPSTNWSNTSQNSTNWSQSSINSTRWREEDTDQSAGALLLEVGDNFLTEDSSNLLLQ